MQSAAKNVTAYLREAPADRRAALGQLRKLCRETLTGYEECMAYGMPGYKKNGVIEVGFASQKNYIALYISKQDVLAAHKALLKGIPMGKGCIRYSRPEKIDFDVVKKMLVGTRQSKNDIC